MSRYLLFVLNWCYYPRTRLPVSMHRHINASWTHYYNLMSYCCRLPVATTALILSSAFVSLVYHAHHYGISFSVGEGWLLRPVMPKTQNPVPFYETFRKDTSCRPSDMDPLPLTSKRFACYDCLKTERHTVAGSNMRVEGHRG